MQEVVDVSRGQTQEIHPNVATCGGPEFSDVNCRSAAKMPIKSWKNSSAKGNW